MSRPLPTQRPPARFLDGDGCPTLPKRNVIDKPHSAQIWTKAAPSVPADDSIYALSLSVGTAPPACHVVVVDGAKIKNAPHPWPSDSSPQKTPAVTASWRAEIVLCEWPARLLKDLRPAVQAEMRRRGQRTVSRFTGPQTSALAELAPGHLLLLRPVQRLQAHQSAES